MTEPNFYTYLAPCSLKMQTEGPKSTEKHSEFVHRVGSPDWYWDKAPPPRPILQWLPAAFLGPSCHLNPCLFVGKSFFSLGVYPRLKSVADTSFQSSCNSKQRHGRASQCTPRHIPCVVTQMLFNPHVRGKMETAAVHLLEKCNQELSESMQQAHHMHRSRLMQGMQDTLEEKIVGNCGNDFSIIADPEALLSYLGKKLGFNFFNAKSLVP